MRPDLYILRPRICPDRCLPVPRSVHRLRTAATNGLRLPDFAMSGEIHEIEEAPEVQSTGFDGQESDDGVTITAKRLRDQQNDQQKRRRTSGGGAGSSTKTSLWSTLAATVTRTNKTGLFHCAICSHEGSLNRALSNSNIITPYKTKHAKVHETLVRLQASKANEVQIRHVLETAHRSFVEARKNNSIRPFFRTNTPRRKNQDSVHDASAATSSHGLAVQPSAVMVTPPNRHVAGPSLQSAHGNSNTVAGVSLPTPSKKVRQPTSSILFACAVGLPLGQLGSPLFQGLISSFDGNITDASKTSAERNLLPVNRAVCRIIRRSANEASSGCLTFDGWSASLGTPVMGVTWHFIDSSWTLKSVPIATQSVGDASKTGVQLCAILEQLVQENLIVGSERLRIHTATSDNEPATALATDLFTNYVGSIRCVVHTIALSVNDVFKPSKPWQKVLDHVNKVTSYFNQHPKANMLFLAKQQSAGVTQDRLQYLKHDIPTRWHSRLAAMSRHLARSEEISAVASELNIRQSQLAIMSKEQENILAEYVTVLGELRRVARQLEADRKVTLSRAPRLLRELYETILLMAGELVPNDVSFYENSFGIDTDSVDDNVGLKPHACIPSCAVADTERDEARKIRLRHPYARQLAQELAQSLKTRLGHIWKQVTEEAASWKPSKRPNGIYGEILHPSLHEPRRVLLYHVAAALDVNECQFEYIDPTPLSRDAYLKCLYRAVAREAVELDKGLHTLEEDLDTIFGMFHKQMLKYLAQKGRQEPSKTLQYWKEQNEKAAMISPVPFNTLARACLASQASSAAAERLFSDLGRMENRQSQSSLTSTLEMNELIRIFISNELSQIRLPQRGLLHPEASYFVRLVDKVAAEMQRESDENFK